MKKNISLSVVGVIVGALGLGATVAAYASVPKGCAEESVVQYRCLDMATKALGYSAKVVKAGCGAGHYVDIYYTRRNSKPVRVNRVGVYGSVKVQPLKSLVYQGSNLKLTIYKGGLKYEDGTVPGDIIAQLDGHRISENLVCR